MWPFNLFKHDPAPQPVAVEPQLEPVSCFAQGLCRSLVMDRKQWSNTGYRGGYDLTRGSISIGYKTRPADCSYIYHWYIKDDSWSSLYVSGHNISPSDQQAIHRVIMDRYILSDRKKADLRDAKRKKEYEEARARDVEYLTNLGCPKN